MILRRWLATGTAAVLAAAVPLFALQGKPPGTSEGPRKESRTASVRRIFQKDRCSFGDTCRMVLSLARGEHTDLPFAELHQELLNRGFVEAEWGLEESAPVTKGTAAFMLVRLLGLPGGVVTRIFGMNRRYAFRECVYSGLLRGKTDMEYLTGRELIDALTDAETFQQAGHLDSEKK